tara:strand:+ start:754 stop:942 length:189 start_codon:yes stop_codon:yes gene_type:complete
MPSKDPESCVHWWKVTEATLAGSYAVCARCKTLKQFPGIEDEESKWEVYRKKGTAKRNGRGR